MSMASILEILKDTKPLILTSNEKKCLIDTFNNDDYEKFKELFNKVDNSYEELRLNFLHNHFENKYCSECVNSILAVAVENNATNIVLCLLNSGARIDVNTGHVDTLQTPIYYSVRNRNFTILQNLINFGAILNDIPYENDLLEWVCLSLFEIAAFNCDFKILSYLLEIFGQNKIFVDNADSIVFNKIIICKVIQEAASDIMELLINTPFIEIYDVNTILYLSLMYDNSKIYRAILQNNETEIDFSDLYELFSETFSSEIFITLKLLLKKYKDMNFECISYNFSSLANVLLDYLNDTRKIRQNHFEYLKEILLYNSIQQSSDPAEHVIRSICENENEAQIDMIILIEIHNILYSKNLSNNTAYKKLKLAVEFELEKMKTIYIRQDNTITYFNIIKIRNVNKIYRLFNNPIIFENYKEFKLLGNILLDRMILGAERQALINIAIKYMLFKFEITLDEDVCKIILNQLGNLSIKKLLRALSTSDNWCEEIQEEKNRLLIIYDV